MNFDFEEFRANLLCKIGIGLIGDNGNHDWFLIISGQSIIKILILTLLFSQIYLKTIGKRVLEKLMFSNLGHGLFFG